MSTQSELRTRPIIFSGDMVLAILEGRKTQTRRTIKLKSSCNDLWYLHSQVGNKFRLHHPSLNCPPLIIECPYGIPGEKLWIRETWKHHWAGRDGISGPGIQYKADGVIYGRVESKRQLPDKRWRHSVHMPRWASRLTLQITNVRVERLKELTDDDCRAEGIRGLGGMVGEQTAMLATGTSSLEEAELITLADGFVETWDKLNAKRGYSWESNPWVWAIEFGVVDG